MMKVHHFANGHRFEVRRWGPRMYSIYTGHHPNRLCFEAEIQAGRRATYGVRIYKLGEAGVPTDFQYFGSQGCRSLQAVLEEIAEILNQQRREE